MTTKNEEISPVSDNAKRVEEIKTRLYQGKFTTQDAISLLSELDRRDAAIEKAYLEGLEDGRKNRHLKLSDQQQYEAFARRELGDK